MSWSLPFSLHVRFASQLLLPDVTFFKRLGFSLWCSVVVHFGFYCHKADSSWGRVRMEFGFTLSNWVDITLQITLKQKAYCLTSLDSYCLEVEIRSMDLSLPIKSMQNLVLSQGNMSFLTCSLYALFGLLHILLLFSTWIKSFNCTGALVTQKLQMAGQSQLTFVYFILDRHHFY